MARVECSFLLRCELPRYRFEVPVKCTEYRWGDLGLWCQSGAMKCYHDVGGEENRAVRLEWAVHKACNLTARGEQVNEVSRHSSSSFPRRTLHPFTTRVSKQGGRRRGGMEMNVDGGRARGRVDSNRAKTDHHLRTARSLAWRGEAEGVLAQEGNPARRCCLRGVSGVSLVACWSHPR